LIVRCLKIVDARGEDTAHHSAISVGDVFVVVEFNAIRGNEPHLRVVRPDDLPEDRLPPLWPASMFEVLDPSVPPNWEVHIEIVDGTSFLKVAPPSWHRPGFWEDLADWTPLSPQAVDDYDRELDTILRESSAR
jgi:hypothetical protein